MSGPESTLFSTERFLRAWLSVDHHEYDSNATLISVPITRAGSRLLGVTRSVGIAGAIAEFGPHGLFAAPWPMVLLDGPVGHELETVLNEHHLSRFTWHVRFDHTQLGAMLDQAAIPSARYDTHVLDLDRPYDEIFAEYSATRRNQIRKCFRRGVTIRSSKTAEDISSYCRVHEELEVAKDFRTRYPNALIRALTELDESVLLIAEVNGRVIAGALFFKDGNSLLYWHGAADRNHSELFPMPALMDAGVQLASQAAMSTFNFGGSPSESLKFFKESFGAKVRQNRTYVIKRKEALRQGLLNRALRRLFGMTTP